MFLRHKFPLAAILLGFAVLATGCNDGTNEEPTITGDTDFSLPPAPEYTLSAADLVGDIAYDFTVAGDDREATAIYRSKLDAGSISFVNEGRLTSTNMLLGGMNSGDVVSTAFVTLIDGVIYIHSRVNGRTIKLHDVRADIVPCDMQADADRDGARALVYITSAGANGSCEDQGPGLAVVLSEGEVSTWTTGRSGSLSEVVYRSDGKIEVLIIDNVDRKAVTLRKLDGTQLATVTGQYRKPTIQAIGSPGATPDDRYLSILNDGVLSFVPVSMMFDPGFTNPAAVLDGLSLKTRLYVPSGPYSQSTGLIIEPDSIYGFDQVTREITLLAEFADKVSVDRKLDDALVLGDTLMYVLNVAESSDPAPRGEIWATDISSEAGSTLIFDASSEINISARTKTHAYFSWTGEAEAETDYRARSVIVDDVASLRIPEGYSRYSEVINHAKGGEDLKVLAFKSDAFSLDHGFRNPELWEISPVTSQDLGIFKRLYKDCVGLEGMAAFDNRIIATLKCDGQKRLSLLDTELGTVNYLIGSSSNE